MTNTSMPNIVTVEWADITAQEFLHTYWQKRPVLIRNAFPGFQTADGLNHFIDANELAGLACETGVESRLIVEDGFGDAAKPWQVENGPLPDQVFAELPETNWTLLVQDVEKHIPEIADVLDAFRFIPAWRMDDVMVSYAVDGGSVGAHTDAYDVFLLQAQGQRRWQIAEQFDGRYREDVELRILQTFQPEAEWVLQPGDMLYLPPNVAHHGVAIGECMTWSIGFRAPSYADIVNDYTDHIVQQFSATQRYADPELQPAQHVAEITTVQLNKIAALHQQLFQADAQTILHWWGQMVTSPKPWLTCEALTEPYDQQSLVAVLDRQGDELSGTQVCYRDTRCIMAFAGGADDEASLWLFVNGSVIELRPQLRPLVELLSLQRQIATAALSPWLVQSDAVQLLLLLFNQGYFYVAD